MDVSALLKACKMKENPESGLLNESVKYERMYNPCALLAN